MQLKGSTFIVTGGASGLGEGTVKMLAEAGANVVIADLQADKGEAIAKQLGQKARFTKCDVTHETDGQTAVDSALKNFGALQGLVQALVTRWIGRVFCDYFRGEMQQPTSGWAGLAREKWNEVTRPAELAQLVKAGAARLGGKRS